MSEYTIQISPNKSRTHTFTGNRLGFGTSQRDSHLHPPNVKVKPYQRCSGCRWTESTIYWSDTDNSYIVHILGNTVVPGERIKVRCIWAEHADGVLDSLLVTPPKHVGTSDLTLPQPNADAMEEASEVDGNIKKTLREWFEG